MAEENKEKAKEAPKSASDNNSVKMVQTAPVVTKLEFASDQNQKKSETRKK